MLKLAPFLLIAASLGGCASITRGTTEPLQVISTPAGANVRTSNDLACVTPCTLTVNRKDELHVTVSKLGYRTQSVEVKTQISAEGAAGFAGNVLLPGGVVGMGIDAVNGAALEHTPNPVAVTLVPEPPPPAPPLAATPPRRSLARRPIS